MTVTRFGHSTSVGATFVAPPQYQGESAMQYPFIRKALLSFALFAVALGLGTPAAAAERIVVSGSTTVLPIMQKAVEAFMKKNPDVAIEVSGGGSGNGLKALSDKTCDIAMSSRAIKDKETEAAKTAGITPLQHVVALDAVLPIVNPKNPVDNLSVEQLRDIFAGKITNWKDVGGADGKIVVISRDTSSGTYETWQEFVMGKDVKVFAGALLQASSGAVLQTVSGNARAIGYDGIGYLNDSVKALKVNGIAGSAETAHNKTYPVSRELFIYTDGEPKGSAADFVAFLKGSEGQALVKQAGFIPLQ